MQRTARIMLALSLLLCRSDGQKLQASPSGNETPAKVHTPLSAQRRRHLLDGRCDLITSVSAMPNSLKDAFATTTKEESFALADPGAKYQATDVVESPTLPFRRLIFAGRCEDRWFIYYEHGGRGHSYAVLIYRADANQVPQLDWGGVGFVVAKGLGDLREAGAIGKFADNLPFHW